MYRRMLLIAVLAGSSTRLLLAVLAERDTKGTQNSLAYQEGKGNHARKKPKTWQASASGH